MREKIASIFILLVLLPNILAFLSPYEDWPFTSAPMFAHYVDKNTPRYKFIFLGRFDNGAEKELGYYSIGANWPLMRYFFRYVYGSVEPGLVFNEYPNDNVTDFEKRVSKFFNTYCAEFEKRQIGKGIKLEKVTLNVAKLGWKDNKPEVIHTVGVYDSDAKSFKHSWSGM